MDSQPGEILTVTSLTLRQQQIQGVESRDTKKRQRVRRTKAIKQACKKVSISCTRIVILNAISRRGGNTGCDIINKAKS